MRISIIVAVAENGVIGRGGELPWRLSADLKRFKQLTMGHTIIMGRRTWESIGRPLPGRRTVVVSRQPGYEVNDEVGDAVAVATSLPNALKLAEQAGDTEAFIVGGAEMYGEGLPRADRLYLTRVQARVDGDTLFPSYDATCWNRTSTEHHPADAKNQFAVDFEQYDRIQNN
ncbi:MAG: dihydrofolate reductase [Pirellulales bacterium]|nr:dihydrofolate reductase [Pirellulales bacterium]